MNPCGKCGQFIRCDCPEREEQISDEERRKAENDAGEAQFKTFALDMLPKVLAFADATIAKTKRGDAPDLEAIWVMLYGAGLRGTAAIFTNSREATIHAEALADHGINAFEERAPTLARRSRLLAAKQAEIEEHDRRPTEPPRPVAVGIGHSQKH